jgi:mRNA-degrading endonuclease RelE of RelBE toxin-antitoxin system
MKRVELAAQVVAFIRAQAPDPRRRLRVALRDLQRERGDIKALEGRLKNHFRLRVGNYRIVFYYAGKNIRCAYIERRDVVYELFEQLIHARLRGREDT